MIDVPSYALGVCQVLHEAGFEAVVVGGCVRDALMGRSANDWDVATSARPEIVMRLFRHVVPTGVAHGTVTVVLKGDGPPRTVEVTTFRGDGTYSDGRHPDTVTFGVPLHEDLARRDLVVNAIAYDPIAQKLIDPFGGVVDIRARRLRAVGEPNRRFTEDGLRILRTMRFAASLEFVIDEATLSAVPACLASLAKVAKERVAEEMTKLFAATRPSTGLMPLWESGAMQIIAPAVAELWRDTHCRQLACERIDRANDRWSAWMGELQDEQAILSLGRSLRLSNEQVRAATVVGAHWSIVAVSAPDLRRLLAGIGRKLAPVVVDMWRAMGEARMHMGERGSEAQIQQAEAAATILASGSPLAIDELAIDGGELCSQLGIAPGPKVGGLLRGLLAHVLADPSQNRPDLLIQHARELS